jgi:hypothetical protein
VSDLPGGEMVAVRLHRAGDVDALNLERVKVPEVGRGEALVRLRDFSLDSRGSRSAGLRNPRSTESHTLSGRSADLLTVYSTLATLSFVLNATRLRGRESVRQRRAMH